MEPTPEQSPNPAVNQAQTPEKTASEAPPEEGVAQLTEEELKAVQELVKPRIYMQWIAPAYRQTEKSKGWYILMGLIVLVFVIYGMLAGDSYGWIVSITFLILAGAYYLTELKPVPAIKVVVSQLGIKVGTRYFPYNQVKSFWILNEDNARHLNLILTKGAPRTTSIIVPEEVSIAQLREYLLLQIREEEGKEESFSEQLIRNLGL